MGLMILEALVPKELVSRLFLFFISKCEHLSNQSGLEARISEVSGYQLLCGNLTAPDSPGSSLFAGDCTFVSYT